MKILKIIGLPILTIFFLTSFSPQAFAQPDQDTLSAFSWEGLSLNMPPAQFYGKLKSDGYKLLKVNEQPNWNKKVSVYQRKTQETRTKIRVIEKDGVIAIISFHEVRVGGRKNLLSEDDVNSKFSQIKSSLGIEDSACRAGAKGVIEGHHTYFVFAWSFLPLFFGISLLK